MNNDPEMQRFVAEEIQKAGGRMSYAKATEMCRNKCVGTEPPSNLDSQAKQCIANCIDLFLEWKPSTK